MFPEINISVAQGLLNGVNFSLQHFFLDRALDALLNQALMCILN